MNTTTRMTVGLLLLIAVACGGGKAGSGGPPTLASIGLAPSPFTLPKGTTQQLTATGNYSDGSRKDVTAQVGWTSGNAATASVNAGGLVTAVAIGSTSITASLGGVQGAASITVSPPVVTALTVNPAAAYLPPGYSGQLQATGTYSDASSADVTALAAWSSGTPAHVTVNASGVVSPTVGAAGQSSSVISATVNGVHATSTIVVGMGPPIGPTLGNDPLLSQQWHLRNTGQNAYADTNGLAGNDLRLGTTYQFGYTGAGVKVAVVDSGLEILHEDLAANVVAGSWNFLTGTADPTSTGTTGDHGTMVAGLIAMVYGNGVGGMGVAPSASLNGYNLLASTQLDAYYVASLGGSASQPTSNDVWIFNQSYGIGTTVDQPVIPLVEAQYISGVTTLRGGKGALYVKSAGNDFKAIEGAAVDTCAGARSIGVSCQDSNMDPNNTLPYNIVVGAQNANGVKSSYSTAGSAIWVSAPGGEYGLNQALLPPGTYPAEPFMPAMVTADQSGCAKGHAQTTAGGGATPATSLFDGGAAPNTSCNYTNTMNGTSSAAPVTSGAIALILHANPTLTWRDVKHILAATATQVDAAIPAVTDATVTGGPYVAELPWITNAAGYKFHNWYGFGRVNVDAAVGMATAYPSGQLGTFTNTGWVSSGTLALAIPDNSVAGATSTINLPATPKSLFVEAVQISVSATHAWTGDLGIELTSPAGTKSILLNIKNGFNSTTGLAAMVLESNAFYGEASAGSWTIKVVDGWAGSTGTLTNWQVRVFGH